jgi:hypothetical protein
MSQTPTGTKEPSTQLIEKKVNSLPYKNSVKKPTRVRSLTRSNSRSRSPSRSARRRKYELLKYRFTQRSIRPSKFLEKMCVDSGSCMAFGREKDRIRSFFDNMDFKYVNGNVPRIGSDSVNGVVHLIKYMRDNYSTYAIMKSSQDATADSLLYEYIVGKYFINDYVSKYPCFMETYGLYEHKNYGKLTKQMLKHNIRPEFFTNPESRFISKVNDSNVLNGLKDEIRRMCTTEYGLKYAILIEFVKEPISFYEYYKAKDEQDYRDPHFVREILNILLQVYIPLGNLMRSFTHNDLHTNNILLYKVPNNQYVEMQYYMAGKETPIVIHTQYIVKIIDYGRCFFRKNEQPAFFVNHSDYLSGDGPRYTMDSNGIAQVLDDITKVSDVNTVKSRSSVPQPQCNGFRNFYKNVTKRDWHISSAIGNISRDITVIAWLYQVSASVDEVPHTKWLGILKGFRQYLSNAVLYINDDYGGKPVETRKCKTGHVCNVEMVRDHIINFYESERVVAQFNEGKYDVSSRLGVMRIYSDGRDMMFVKE